MPSVELINERRQRTWLRNALRYRAQRLFCGNRSSVVWAFGAWEGCRYSDNARALFEYVSCVRSDIEAAWIACDESVVEQVKASGLRAFMADSDEGRRFMRRAGACFYTNGLDDFGSDPGIYGSFIVNLFHGVGFKKVYHELSAPHRMSLRAALGRGKRWLFDWVKSDALVTTTSTMERRYRRGFGLPSRCPVLLTGQPRNDALAVPPVVSSCISKACAIAGQIADARAVVLYMPTWTSGGDGSLARFMEQVACDDQVQNALEEHGALFILKPHYLSDLGTRHFSHRVCALSDAEVVDNDGLIASATAVITDFSSCVVDFAVSGKPTAYCRYREMSKEELRGIDQDYHMLYKRYGLHDMGKLASFLSGVLNGAEDSVILTRELNERFGQHSIPVGSYSKATCDAVCGLLGIGE